MEMYVAVHLMLNYKGKKNYINIKRKRTEVGVSLIFPTVLDVSYHFIIALSCVKDTKLINNKKKKVLQLKVRHLRTTQTTKAVKIDRNRYFTLTSV